MENKTGKYQTKQNLNQFVQSPTLESKGYKKALQQLNQTLYYDIEWGGPIDVGIFKNDIKNQSEKTITPKKQVLDVFDRIAKREERNLKKVEFEKLGIVEQNGEFVVASPVFVGSKVDVQNFEYQPRKYPQCQQYGRAAEDFANAFYDYVMKRKKANKNLLEDKKFNTYLQAGVNFVYLSDEMEGELYKQLSAEELRVLFDYGMNIELAIYEASCRKDIQEKLVYNAVEQVESPVFFVISPSNLEKLIHTRNNISLYNGFWTDYIAYADENHKFEYIKNVEVMFKYGQISLTPQQIKTMGDRFSSRLDSVPYIKSVYEYCKYMTKFTTTEPQVDNSKTKQNKVPTPQEIKNQIDKLFEDAQKNI